MEQILNAVQTDAKHELPGQVVLVLQGGGALGAYQAGVYEGLHEAGIEPDWVIGTSIGAINGAIIVGNPIERRLDRIRGLWTLIEQKRFAGSPFWPWMSGWITNLETLLRGIPRLFLPNPAVVWGLNAPLGAERAAFYSAEALRSTLRELVDIEHLR